jgi:hypothetical protein
MSNYYGTYSQYLGAQKCCSIKTQGPQGPPGPTGPAAVGPQGASAYTAYATYGSDSSPTVFYLNESGGDNKFYSDSGYTSLIGIPITLPVAGKIWAINISIVETNLNQLQPNSTFNIRFYTTFNSNPATGFGGTQKVPFCFNGSGSYIINSSTVAIDRMAASNNDIIDLTGTTETTWYIQLNQFDDAITGSINGNFKFCITMNTLN